MVEPDRIACALRQHDRYRTQSLAIDCEYFPVEFDANDQQTGSASVDMRSLLVGHNVLAVVEHKSQLALELVLELVPELARELVVKRVEPAPIVALEQFAELEPLG